MNCCGGNVSTDVIDKVQSTLGKLRFEHCHVELVGVDRLLIVDLTALKVAPFGNERCILAIPGDDVPDPTFWMTTGI
jgi:hypothetical protein